MRRAVGSLKSLVDGAAAPLFVLILSPRSFCRWTRYILSRQLRELHLEGALNALGIGCK